MEKFDLGKFLSDAGVNIDTAKREQIEYISIDLIVPDPENFYELSGLDELAENISLFGIRQPLRVRNIPGDESRVMIVSGHRRHAALKKLIDEDGRDDLRDVPCIVEPEAQNPHLVQLALIYDNADNRKISSAEQARQVEQVEKLLYQLKEDGYEFPGRMRDHVAQACKLSTGKIARLKVIRENLEKCWNPSYQQDKFGESTAYALAQMPKAWQETIFERWGSKPNMLYADTVKKFMERLNRISKLTCSHSSDSMCAHREEMSQKAVADSWQDPCIGCCFDCVSLRTCKSVCPLAAEKKKELRDTVREAERAAVQRQEEREQPQKELLALSYERMAQLRKERGVSVEDCVKASLGYAYDANVKRMSEIECGKTAKLTDRMPGGIWAGEAQKLIATADLLGCTLDYLLGRTEYNCFIGVDLGVPAAPEKCVNIDTWRTGDPEEHGEYAVMVQYDPDEKAHLSDMLWGGEWLDSGAAIKELGFEVLCWTPLPDVSNLTPKKFPLNEGCITGMSPTGHCGAAACCDEPFTCCLQCPYPCNSQCGWSNADVPDSDTGEG